MAKSTSANLHAALAGARSELDAAHHMVEVHASREGSCLEESDEAYGAWFRQKRLYEKEVARLNALVSKFEADIATEEANAMRAAYAVRYNAAAARNREIVERYRAELPKAWAIIANLLEAAALAQIETEAVIKAMPADYTPRTWIGDPDRTVRCRPPIDDEIVSEQIVELWADPKTGNTFANRSAPPSVTSVKRQFKEVTYRPFQPAGDVPPFYRDLKVPRLDAIGSRVLFDGAKLRGPYDVLEALRQSRQRSEKAAPYLTRIEPLTPEIRASVEARISPPVVIS
ncbi:MAG: hypothetical protein Q8M31_23570 [Beijerinckiaceae bacterium]|nr:hypothetical protein [Beijerinckiaceae bacterium]